MSWLRGFFISIFICAASSVALAEPTPGVRALMNEEVSLFSFGIYQLRERIRGQVISELKGFTGVEYDWKTNRLKLSFIETQRPGACGGKDDNKCRATCEKQYENIRSLLCFGESCKDLSLFAMYFSHIGYSRKGVRDQSSDAEVAESLKDITEIEVRLKLSEDFSRRLVCEGPITRGKPSFRVDTR